MIPITAFICERDPYDRPRDHAVKTIKKMVVSADDQGAGYGFGSVICRIYRSGDECSLSPGACDFGASRS